MTINGSTKHDIMNYAAENMQHIIELMKIRATFI